MNANTTLIRASFDLVKRTASEWMEDGALRLSAALAYYSVFSIAPLLVLAMGLAGWFFGADAVRGHLDDQLRGLVGAQAAQAVQIMVQSTSKPLHSFLAMVAGIVTLLIGASGIFAQLKDALNTMWEVKAKSGLGISGFLRERLLSFGMVLVIGFLLLVSFLLTTLLSAFNHWVESILKLPSWVWGTAGFLVSFAVVTLLFALIFKVLPDVQIAWRHVWIGAVATALLFEIGKFLLGWYLGRESTASGFGAAGSVVLLLLWVYYASCILLFGAEFTKVYAIAHGAELEPTELAEPVTAEARAQQGMKPRTDGSQAEPAPPRESLPAIFGEAHEHLKPGFPRSLREVLPYLRESVGANLLAAVSCGFAIGLISRKVGPAQEDPVEQVKASSRILGAAGLLLLARFGRTLLKQGRTLLPAAVDLNFKRLRKRTAKSFQRMAL